MSLMIANRQVMSAAQQLTRAWDQLREAWDDPVSQRIEQRFIRNLHHDVRTAMTALEQMHEVMEEAVRVLATHDDAPYSQRRSTPDEGGETA
ncbi:MAG: hypothetical protein MK116_05870 [Phycisphaerales bacterium]|nr:hypothetical protein [Phycisphaerales bacterium]